LLARLKWRLLLLEASLHGLLRLGLLRLRLLKLLLLSREPRELLL
jgi:hypothetical protein